MHMHMYTYLYLYVCMRASMCVRVRACLYMCVGMEEKESFVVDVGGLVGGCG